MVSKDGEREAPFPKTRLSAVIAARSGDDAERRGGSERLVAAYWKPVYKLVRVKWRRAPDEAEDVTQAFFAAMFEKRFFEGFDPARGRFRTYLRATLDHFVADDDKSGRRLKRGGGVTFVSFEFSAAEVELTAAATGATEDIEAFFAEEWKRSLFAAAAAALRADCEARGKSRHYRVFEAFYLTAGEPPRYSDIARALDIPVTDVTNSLTYARRQFRRLVLDELRSLCATEEEFELEANALGLLEGR